MKTEVEYKSELQVVDLEMKQVEKKLSELKEKRNGILIDTYRLRTGFNQNDTVQWESNDMVGGKRQVVIKTGIILSFSINHGSKVQPTVGIHKKDGTVGERTKDYWYESERLSLITTLNKEA